MSSDYPFEEYMEDASAFSTAQIGGGADPSAIAWPYFLANYKPEELARTRLRQFWEIRSFIQRKFAELGCPFDDNGFEIPVDVNRAVWAVFTTRPRGLLALGRGRMRASVGDSGRWRRMRTGQK